MGPSRLDDDTTHSYIIVRIHRHSDTLAQQKRNRNTKTSFERTTKKDALYLMASLRREEVKKYNGAEYAYTGVRGIEEKQVNKGYNLPQEVISI